MLRTKLLQQLPWIGGVNTSLDPSMLPPNQLVQGDNLLFDTRGSRKKRKGINFDWDDQSNSSESIIGLKDFWYGTAPKTQTLVGVTDGKKVYTYDVGTGARSANLFAGTAWSSSVTSISFEVLNDLLVIAVDGSGNVLKKYNGSGNIADLGGTPPVASICREHLGRLWTNDKTNNDRLHYSTTGNPEEWNGTGDSGALDIGVKDGDPEGITAIFPTFKGVLFVAKKTKLYRITGFTPEEFQVELVSSGIGCVSHNSITQIDQDDMFFASERGLHSVAATDQFGGFSSTFLSADIQKTFSEEFTLSRLKYIQGAYLSNINSAAFAVTDETVGTGANNALWLYNIPLKAWYRWPGISCQALTVVRNSDQSRFFLGTNTTRVARTFTGENSDTSTSGSTSPISCTIKTGILFPDDQVFTTKGFKRLLLYYRPVGTHTLLITVRIDNYANQTSTISNFDSSDLLGSTFVLGSSVLGSTLNLGPYGVNVDGYGHGVQLTIQQTGSEEEVEIQGFAFEWEPAEVQREVVASA